MADTAGYPTHDAKALDSVHNNKRKRESRGDHASRPAPGDSSRATNSSAGAADLTDQTTAAFLAAHNAAADDSMQNSSLDFGLQQNGGASSSNAGDTAAAALAHYSMTVPQATELSFQATGSAGDGTSFMGDHGVHQQQQHGMPDTSMDVLQTPSKYEDPGNSAANDSPPNAGGHKPTVGSDEWHKVRRDNHKEVERRRRETINEGINELAKIVPGCEKNKGSILQRAVQFITQLKENESQNIEKWTLEKLLTEQAITELSGSCEKFKGEMQRAWDEVEIYKRACRNAGIVPPEIKERENAEQNGE
ncbi:uncharacterized protein BDZ99DRAFT_518956 [Mytilinidion resinicola]|uniref:BHLH domain-containing protein n=1 Tax=Mytilinidion resinicola TaxID=574789 RepID=A0A6A6YTK2_9PEZI|nr:uncharacterized protein BDZ99DRAFT_518956 [Mytilinidion resinicola]KAF2811703.1 hypothetical protein BDZ99DRAFT_518956 [Mytilinidion resinicola]